MFKRILWAVDAYPGSQELQEQGGRAVRTFADGLKASVEAAWVEPPKPPSILIPSAPLDAEPPSEKTTNRNLLRLVRTVLPDAAQPRTLHASRPSITVMVNTLIEYAQRENYDVIAVITHARKGVPRWFIGSFAETLILKSPLPVLISRAKTPDVKSFEHVLFPTDFSEASRNVFEQVVAMAKDMVCDVLLLHQRELTWTPVGFPFVVPPVDLSSMEDVGHALKEEGEAWAEWARAQGVRARFHLVKKPGDPVTSIINAAKKLPACFIAMAAQSGNAETVFLGSVARQVVRGAHHPVLVIHRPARAAAAKDESDVRHAVLS